MLINTISILLEQRGVSMAAVRRETGLNRETLARYVRDRTKIPTGEVLSALCDYFGCQPGLLLMRVGDDQELDTLLEQELETSFHSVMVYSLVSIRPRVGPFTPLASNISLDLLASQQLSLLINMLTP
jgi:putative transcriptional regulator